MDHQTFNIHNEEDFKRITNGIKIAQCMRFKSSIPEADKTTQIEDLVVSDSLSCNFCNTIFEDRDQQRLHYKLDWHRYNLKQRLHGFKTVSEDAFGLIADKDDVSSISGSESESGDDISDTKDSTNRNAKNESLSNKNTSKNLKQETKEKITDLDSSPDEDNEELIKEKKTDALVATANRHTKVFFENVEGHIFSIYRCLLHNKKEIPEQDNEIINQALGTGRRQNWTVIMLGGGHFAAAVFLGGEAIVHKTFHCYTVRAKQGSSQSSRDNRSNNNHPKSAGASLRRYNENALIQHVQDIISSWAPHINKSSLILYRAVGPQNRTVLFGGRSPPLDKNDPRLRPLPFPTRRATFKEVKRVYEVVSSIEVYGPAINFIDSFPISPRQVLRKKSSKLSSFDEIDATDSLNNKSGTTFNVDNSAGDNGNHNKKSQSSTEKPSRSLRPVIDRAKLRKSPNRPLPFDNDINSEESSSYSDGDVKVISGYNLITKNVEINFKNDLELFHDTVPRHMKNKKNRQKKRKERKDKVQDTQINEILAASKVKLWTSCRLGDTELFDATIQDLLAEVKRTESMNISPAVSENLTFIPMNVDDITKLVNEIDENGNTMLHIAAAVNCIKVVWSLLSIGSDPCMKNKNLQTPYSVTTDRKTRNTFRRFMGEYPDKYCYSKSQIPGPLNDEIELEEVERKKQQKKVKRVKVRARKKELELIKQEEDAKQRFLELSDKKKRAVTAEGKIQEGANTMRCFQCGNYMLEQSCFEYNANKFCSMPCLKEHRIKSKVTNESSNAAQSNDRIRY